MSGTRHGEGVGTGGTHIPSATLDPGLGPHCPWVLSVSIPG